MKLSKTLQVAAIFAAASVSVATAAAPKSYTLHISGSTAFRGATHNAIANILTNPKAAYIGASLSGASQATFTGTIGVDNWTIQTSWSGSEAGVAAAAQTTTPYPTIAFLSVAGNLETAVTKAVAPAAITGGNAITGTPVLEQAVVDVAMTDVFVASTPFHGTVGGKTYSGLVGANITGQPGAGIVGVVPFKFIATAKNSAGKSYVPTSVYDGLGNMTDSLAKNVFTKQGAVLSQFSGVAADSAVKVYALGRDHDSGTRAAAVFCTGIDKPGTSVTAIQQYYPTDIDGNIIAPGDVTTKIGGVTLVPLSKVNNISYAVGASGYASGGNLAKAFTNPLDASFKNSLFVTYLSVGDAKTALAGNAQEMTYNGVVYSPEAVKEGTYTFWAYEHLLYKSTIQNATVSSALKATATKIATQIAKSDAAVSGLVYDSSFHVKRNPNTVDGALVTR